MRCLCEWCLVDNNRLTYLQEHNLSRDVALHRAGMSLTPTQQLLSISADPRSTEVRRLGEAPLGNPIVKSDRCVRPNWVHRKGP